MCLSMIVEEIVFKLHLDDLGHCGDSLQYAFGQSVFAFDGDGFSHDKQRHKAGGLACFGADAGLISDTIVDAEQQLAGF